ncbi:DUF4153 domain-containing protein [Streptosporangium sp. NPDC050855]|uniref:DUF4153 domain-containing protein n=1 Tax=Streptosporangium sp. NPDC050855 TaxID=3366194 RepID=UPI00379CF199
MRPLDFLGRIKAKLGMVILLAVVAAFVVNEVGINAGYSRDVRVAVAAVFALIMVQLLARGMTKPLREMAAAAQTIAKGRYGLRVTATSRDEVGELARAFNAMAADLGEVDRQRRELVANVSHELRTPITALRAVLENVVDGVSDPDPVTLGTALAQTERLGRLVAQLLDLSRLESGARLIEREDVELRPLCEQALREAVLAREGVTARCEVPEGLSLRADPDLLAQVLANLLDNAVRHSPAGGVVVLAAAASGDGVRLRVSDQGPGIAAEDRTRAFERFSRLDAGRAADDGGAGLGLAITKEIVELHGGSIRVEDGVGCHVVTDLPERIEMTSPSSPAQGSPAHGPVGAGVSARVPSTGEPPAREAPSRTSRALEPTASESLVVEPSVPEPAAPESAVVESLVVKSPASEAAVAEAGEGRPGQVAGGAGPLAPVLPGRGPADGTPPGGPPEPDGPPVPFGSSGLPESSGTAGSAGSRGPDGPATSGDPGTAGSSGSSGGSGSGSGEPGGPGGSDGPGGPGGSDGPSGSGGSAGPGAPAAPVGPAGPAGPGGPSGPDGSGGSGGADEGDEPARPTASPASPSPSPSRVPPYPPQPVLVRSGDARPQQVVVRNWAGAFLGVFLGGVAGGLCAMVVGIAMSGIDSMLGMMAAAVLFVGGGFVGTVLGATTSFNDPLAVHERLPDRHQVQGAVARRVPAGQGATGPVSGSTSAAGAAVAGAGAAGASGGTTPGTTSPGTTNPGTTTPGTPYPRGTSQAGTSQAGANPGTAGVTVPARTQAGVPGGRGAGGYEAPPILPRPDLPDTPRWVLPASAAVGLLAAVAVPYSRAGLGLVLVAVAMGAAVFPAVRRRITPWSVALAAIAYGLVVTVLFRDADWLVGVVSLAGFLTAALALSGAGRGWFGVLRGGASVILGLLPVPWFLGPRLRALAARGRVMPLLVGGGLTVVLLVVFGALFASADAVFAEAVERVLSVQDWAESMPLRIVLFVVFAATVASAVLVGLRPVAEPRTPGFKVAAGRILWVLPLTALNLLFATFVGMQLTVLFGSTRWVVSATGLTYAEYARSGFFQLVVVSVFVLAIVAVASGALELKGFDRWLMAGLLGLLCVLTLVVLVSALHRLGLYADAYGLSRLRASVAATVWWLGGVFALVLAAGAARLVGRGQAYWLPRTLVVMTSVSLLAFALWNPDLRVAETQIAVRGPAGVDLDYLGDLGAEAVPALDRLPEPARSCVLRDVVAANDLAGPDPWNGWNLARGQARELLASRPVLEGVVCPQTVSRSDIPSQY